MINPDYSTWLDEIVDDIVSSDTPMLVWIYEPGTRGKVYTVLVDKATLREDGTCTYNGQECRWERLK